MRALCALQAPRISLRLPAMVSGVAPFLEIVGADEQHHRRRVQREHVVLQPDEHAARRVAVDAAIGDLDAGERQPEGPPFQP